MLHNSRCFRLVLLVATFALLTASPLPPLKTLCFAQTNDQPPTSGELRYGWKPDQTAIYAVTVSVERDSYIDQLKGIPSFTVKSANDDQITLRFQGTLDSTVEAKPGVRLRPFRPGRLSAFSPFTGVTGSSRQAGSSEVTINRRGELVRMQGSSQLPFMLGNLSQLMLETLPEKSGTTWTIHNNTSIAKSRDRLPRPRALGNRNETTTAAKEETVYAVEENSNDTVVIRKTYSLRTTETIDGKPAYEITGQGKLVYDKQLGLFQSLEFEQRNIVREEQASSETPVRVSFRLLSDAEQKQLAETARIARETAAKPPSDEERDEIVADLKSNEQGRFLKRLLSLQRQIPAMPDEELAAALQGFLQHETSSIRFAAAKALKNWATPETTPALLKALQDDTPIVRHSAMDALGQLRAKQAIEPIAERLGDDQDRFKAAQILKDLGTIAEPAVLKQAENEQWQVRTEVCVILKLIGTQKSVAVLMKLQNDKHALVKRRAQDALDAINKRSLT